jgi:hypothetical protein
MFGSAFSMQRRQDAEISAEIEHTKGFTMRLVPVTEVVFVEKRAGREA